MKYWEFLIQKEGDETWLPLETQQVEILEGRYRVVAHTDRVNTPMEIKVSQLVTTEMPPRKRVRKRTGETNDAGLVVVMPYVHLKPGQWELTCRSLSTVENLVEGDWQYQVQLQVFAHTEEDWSSEWPVPDDAQSVRSALREDAATGAIGTTTTQSVASEDTPLFQAQAQLQDNLQRQGQASAETDTSHLDSLYQISLRQQAFLARRNQSMTIMGQVQARPDAQSFQGVSQLWLRLQNPENAQVIMEASRPLSLDRLPADFKVKIQLPGNVKTRVVLGEVSLRAAAIEAGEPSKILSSKAFTITAGIDQLLDDIANHDLSTVEVDSFEEEFSEPELVSPILDPTRQYSVPAVGVVLPPKLDQPLIVSDGPVPNTAQQNHHDSSQGSQTAPATTNSAESQTREPELPRHQPLVSQPAQFMGTSIEDDDLETAQIAALLEDIDGDLASQSADMDRLEPPGIAGVLPVDPPQAAGKETSLNASEVPTPVQDFRTQAERRREEQSKQQAEASLAFKSLKLKDHFWKRLTTLTHESHEEAAQLAENMKAAGVDPGSRGANSGINSGINFKGTDQTTQPTSPIGATSQEVLPANSEVVIYDAPPASNPPITPLADNSQTSSTPAHTQSAPLPPSPTPNMPPPEEMALPVISVPRGDLIAGDMVTITVRSQPSAYKPFIKLWMIDRQSRTLVGEPKLLTNLKPDALGYLETSAELRVPMGCLDVQIAAIAVDMATQQESKKAIVNRHVVPANQSPAPLRNFNL